MTDRRPPPSPPGHPDIEGLSAYLDGEAPEWDEHVRTCPPCRAELDRLRAVVASVKAPVAPPSAQARDRAVSRALEAAWEQAGAATTAAGPRSAGAEAAPTQPTEPTERARPMERAGAAGDRRVTPIARRSSRVWVAVASAAAVVGLVVAGGVLTRGGIAPDRGTVALGGGEASPEAGVAEDDLATGENTGEERSRESVAGATSAGPAHLGDVGELRDPDSLRARVRALSTTRDGALAESQAPTGPQPLAAAPSHAAPSPAADAAAPDCTATARSLRPELGAPTIFATGTVKGVPVVVLGFGPEGLTLLAMAPEDGCAIVLEAVGP